MQQKDHFPAISRKYFNSEAITQCVVQSQWYKLIRIAIDEQNRWTASSVRVRRILANSLFNLSYELECRLYFLVRFSKINR